MHVCREARHACGRRRLRRPILSRFQACRGSPATTSHCSHVPRLLLKKPSLCLPWRRLCRNLSSATADLKPTHSPCQNTSQISMHRYKMQAVASQGRDAASDAEKADGSLSIFCELWYRLTCVQAVEVTYLTHNFQVSGFVGQQVS